MFNTDKLPLIIAHRGASVRAPENTIAAFREAIHAGADGIEFDVRLAKDGVPVVIHDPTLKRTGRVGGKVAEMTSAELVRTDVGSWFNDAYPSKGGRDFRGETVPTLAATLDYLKGYGGRIYVELKCSDNEIERLSRVAADVIENSLLARSIVVKSFKLGVIPYFRMCCPYVKTAALFAPKVMRILRKEKYLVKIAEEFGADHLSLHYSLATRKLMKRVERNAMPVTIWTADNPRWVKRAMKLGLNAIITNDPARLIARRSELL